MVLTYIENIAETLIFKLYLIWPFDRGPDFLDILIIDSFFKTDRSHLYLGELIASDSTSNHINSS